MIETKVTPIKCEYCPTEQPDGKQNATWCYTSRTALDEGEYTGVFYSEVKHYACEYHRRDALAEAEVKDTYREPADA